MSKYVGCDVDDNTYEALKQKLDAAGITIASFFRIAAGLYLDDVWDATKADVKLYSKETLNRGGKRR